jgi:hypothetical protein
MFLTSNFEVLYISTRVLHIYNYLLSNHSFAQFNYLIKYFLILAFRRLEILDGINSLTQKYLFNIYRTKTWNKFNRTSN